MMRLLDGTILRSNNQRDAYSQAECYREGRLVTASERRALALYRRAAEEGDARAYFRLGQHEQTHLRWNSAFELFLQAGLRGNNDVIAWLDTLVSQNNAEAALVLGKITQYKRQYDQAIQSYTKAHELNHPDGMFYFGKMYSNLTNTQTRGIDITNRYRDSARLGSKHGLNELLLLSASNGKASLHLAQMYELGEVVHKNLLKAIELYEKSSQQNCSDATYYLAELYARGAQEVAVDISKACRYYLLASQQGKPSAISSWRALAQRGSAEAQYRLGYDYYRTLSLGSRNYSTQYDIPNAVTWCVKAEIQGHASAAAYLSGKFTAEIFWRISNEYASSTLNVERCQQKAVEYGMKASDLGFKDASLYLAHIFQQGNLEISADRQKSYFYYALAASQGDDSAKQTLEQLAETGNKSAQYYLGYGYYREKNDIQRAVYWCVKAEINEYKKAAEYLKTTFSADIYWVIGCQYEEDSVNPETSLPKAVEFFKKAAQLNHVQASFWLGQFYQSRSERTVENATTAFNYFLQSAQNGHEAALPALERLGVHMNIQQQIAIGQLYGSMFYNPERSAYWSSRNETTHSRQIKLTK